MQKKRTATISTQTKTEILLQYLNERTSLRKLRKYLAIVLRTIYVKRNTLMVNHLVNDLNNLEEISFFFPFSQPFVDKIVFEGFWFLRGV